MKILKKPDVSKWNHTYHCNKCDSDLEVVAADLKYYSYDGDCREPGYECYTCNCAVCGDQHTVGSVPKLIQLEVKARYHK